MAEICVKAVIAVADLQRKDVNLELIKVSRHFTTCYRVVRCSNKPMLLLNAQAMLQQSYDLESYLHAECTSFTWSLPS